jgi:chemotaxis protein MotB
MANPNRNEEEGSVYELTRGHSGRKGSSAGWVMFVLALALAAGAGYFAYGEHNRADSQYRRVTDAEAKQKELSDRLAAAEAERTALLAAKDELAKNVQTKDEELSKLKGTYDQLQEKLKGELSSGEIRLDQSGGRLRVDLVDKILFNSGEAQVSKRGENVLMRLGSILASIADKQITVSGHTDQTPIGEKRSAQFPTNWELSTARATNVVRFLQEKAEVPGERLAASGYSEYHPIASNKSSTGRARNRRIEILLTPSLAPKAIGKTKLKEEAKAAVAVAPPPPAAHKKKSK